MSSSAHYLDQLFISRVRIKALKYFMQNQVQPIHLRAAVRELGEEINAVRRELARLEKIGFLTTERKGNRKYFHIAKDFVFYDELLGLIYKSFGLGAEIISNKNLGKIKFATLTQGFTRDIPVGKHTIDLLVVGEDLNLEILKGLIDKEERRIGRDIYYAILSEKDFQTRKQRKDSFVQELILQDMIMLIGNKAEFLGV